MNSPQGTQRRPVKAGTVSLFPIRLRREESKLSPLLLSASFAVMEFDSL